jgi:phosphatidylinositol glycan class W
MAPFTLVPTTVACMGLCALIALWHPSLFPPTDPITLYRSIMMTLTSIAILAVDFTSFPRRFCKAEEGGIGLMDLGVSSFMFSSALVSRLSRASLSTHQPSSAHQRRSAVAAPPALKASAFCKTVLPLYILGLARFATVSAADYQAHISEYGVHWNFFLTMAVVTTVMWMLPLKPLHALPLAAVLALFHQVTLYMGARDYILYAPRTSGFFSANREGIIGSIGYMSIYLFSVAIGSRYHCLPNRASNILTLLCVAAAAAAGYAACCDG